MIHLFAAMVRWLVRHLASLLMIIAILLCGNWLHTRWDETAAARAQLKQLQSERLPIRDALFKAAQDLEQQLRLGAATNAGITALQDSVAASIKAKEAERSQLKTEHPIAVKVPTKEEFKRVVVLDMELSMLEEAQAKTAALTSLTRYVVTGQGQIETLKWNKYQAEKRVYANKLEQWQIRGDYPTLSRLWFSSQHDRLQELDTQLPGLEKRVADAQGLIANLAFAVSFTQGQLAAARSAFNIGYGSFEKAVANIDEVIERDSRVLSDSFFAALQERFWPTVKDVLPTALGVLASIILVPIGIKMFFYYIIAPWAARHEPICIAPRTAGRINDALDDTDTEGVKVSSSGVSLKIPLKENEELLVHSDFIQSSSMKSRKNTKWVLNWHYLFSSLAAGMYALTRVLPYRSEPTVVSSSTDSSVEVAAIELQQGATIVLQGHALVGVVQKRERPLRITSYWRLGHLHSWLTLQLRFLVFHGPATLIVKGCRGVRLEPAGTGRIINQAATLGFSANLQYSVTRCETFVSYWRGEQKLFNDKMAGGAGVYIYEEIPGLTRKSGITGRGLEGLTDALLKVFGI